MNESEINANCHISLSRLERCSGKRRDAGPLLMHANRQCDSPNILLVSANMIAASVATTKYNKTYSTSLKLISAGLKSQRRLSFGSACEVESGRDKN